MLDDLGNLGNFIGVLVVVFSLIYREMQVRRNTATDQAASIDSATRAVWEFMELLTRDIELLRLYCGNKGFQGTLQWGEKGKHAFNQEFRD